MTCESRQNFAYCSLPVSSEPHRFADLFADVIADQGALLYDLLREHAPRVHRAARKLQRRLRALLGEPK